jgi:transposase
VLQEGMKVSTQFKSYNMDQPYLLPPDMRDWLSEDDLVFFIHDVVAELDLKPIYQKYQGRRGGQPPYHPQMMVALLIYAYCKGIPSSRKIQKATYESIPFRVLTADQHPDHDTIADFRKRHLKELSALFVQVLRLCQKAGLVKLGHVALDGTKIKANASKHKAMSYGRMVQAIKDLEKEVSNLLDKASETDASEDKRYGRGRRGDEWPDALKNKTTRLQKIKEAMKALEDKSKQKAETKKKEYVEKKKTWEAAKGQKRGRPPQEPSKSVNPKSQRNFTDPESKIMKDGATKSFVQGYNAQAAVDEKRQIIVSSRITESAVDKQQLIPGVKDIKIQMGGQTPKRLSADAGYYSENNISKTTDVDLYVSPGKEKHSGGKKIQSPRGRISKAATVKERMQRKLNTIKGRLIYAKRKSIVEPVFGQIKQVRGFRQFSFRGKENVGYEWDLICLTHNLLKLFKYG